MPKRVETTRWSSRHFACRSPCESRNETLEVLSLIENDGEETPKTRCEARGLKKDMNKCEFFFLSLVWNVILERFYHSNNKLQNQEGDLKLTVQLYQSLTNFIIELRTEDKFKNFLNKTEKITETKFGANKSEGGQRQARVQLAPDESRDNEIVLKKEEKLRISIYYAILDTVISQLQRRQKAYNDVSEKFSFLFRLHDLSCEDVEKEAKTLQKFYKDHIESSFPLECIHYKEFLRTLCEDGADGDVAIEKWTIADFYRYFKKKNLQAVFPNVDIVLRIFLSMAITNCSAERSFSVLKRIKNYLRSSLGDEKLWGLAVLAIEHELTNAIDFEELISDFANMKARRKV